MGGVWLEAGERTPAGISSCCCQVCGGSSLATSHSYIFPFFWGVLVIVFFVFSLLFIFSDGCGTFSYSLQTDKILTFKLYKCPYVSLVIN